MEAVILLVVLLYVPGVFFIKKRYKYVFSLIPLLFLIALSSYYAVQILGFTTQNCMRFTYSLGSIIAIPLVIDRVSAFFILTVNFTMLTATLFAGKYLAFYKNSKTSLAFSVHYLSLIMLYLSMILVCMLREAFSFLAAWEVMTLSSFLLVIFEASPRSTLKTGVNYLVQMHIGMFILLIAFLISSGPEGELGFDSLSGYFHSHSNFSLFLLFFAGFGIKAGFIPFHSWLPDAHPAAPSHVSGIMSGVMIKMGIYGIVRVLFAVQSGFFEIGLFLLGISIITGIYGVLQAIAQHDIKKLLAYHSIENIGIIGIGLGLGCLGIAMGNSMLTLLGFAGGLLHVLNHSLFKSLLFFTSGSVYQATHIRDINLLGGLIKKMPYTTAFFILGSIAICGLPPFNGFISEYLIYLSIIGNLHQSEFYFSFILILSLLGLTLIGGLALFCFTKVTGVMFLGEARSVKIHAVKETSLYSLLPMILITMVILAIGFLPLLFVNPIMQIIGKSLLIQLNAMSNLGIGITFMKISVFLGIFLLLSLVILFLRHYISRKRQVSFEPTWGCGYTPVNTRMQYTASSFSDNVTQLAGKIVNVDKDYETTGEDIFAEKKSFSSSTVELLVKTLIDKPFLLLRKTLRNIAFLQTGQVQHYILYPFIFILIILLLTLLNVL